MNQRNAPRITARFVTLLQYLQAAAEQIIADLAKRDLALADLGQLVGAVKRLALPVGFEGEELRHSHRDAVQNALQCADGRVHLVGFDQRDRRVGHPRTLGKLTLREFVAGADEAQPFADIDAHHRLWGWECAVDYVADRTNAIELP